MDLNKWEHPTTGEVRVYVNWGAIPYGYKAFFKSATCPKWDLVVTSGGMSSRARREEISAMVVEAVAGAAGLSHWSDLAELDIEQISGLLKK